MKTSLSELLRRVAFAAIFKPNTPCKIKLSEQLVQIAAQKQIPALKLKPLRPLEDLLAKHEGGTTIGEFLESGQPWVNHGAWRFSVRGVFIHWQGPIILDGKDVEKVEIFEVDASDAIRTAHPLLVERLAAHAFHRWKRLGDDPRDYFNANLLAGLSADVAEYARINLCRDTLAEYAFRMHLGIHNLTSKE